MQSKYGNKDGVFASWGDLVNSNYDPEKFFRTGVNTINSVSLSTGTSKNQTYVSVSATNSNGILPNNKYERYNVSGRNTASFLNDKLVLDFGANLIFQNDRNMTAQDVISTRLPLYTCSHAEKTSMQSVCTNATMKVWAFMNNTGRTKLKVWNCKILTGP
ncbi:hypothetical protein SFC43_19985 [Bacteroides sp. CR5/BHMF/2]|nr:hypothetical protein [Bacteroides sp. CR5/BHMF/2]